MSFLLHVAVYTVTPPPVPPVPKPPQAALVSSMSTALIVAGIVVVAVVLPPVRARAMRLVDAVRDRFSPRRVVVISTAPAADTAPASPPVRREIEDFDLDLFA